MRISTENLIAALWQKHRPKVFAQVNLLEHAAATTPLPESRRADALAVAHKLAGSLGMYGYPAGTEAARLLEQELDQLTPNPATLQHLLQQLRQALEQTNPTQN